MSADSICPPPLQLKIEQPDAANDDEEDNYTPSSELRVQSKGTAGGGMRQERRRASVEAEQAALMVRSEPTSRCAPLCHPQPRP